MAGTLRKPRVVDVRKISDEFDVFKVQMIIERVRTDVLDAEGKPVVEVVQQFSFIGKPSLLGEWVFEDSGELAPDQFIPELDKEAKKLMFKLKYRSYINREAPTPSITPEDQNAQTPRLSEPRVSKTVTKARQDELRELRQHRQRVQQAQREHIRQMQLNKNVESTKATEEDSQGDTSGDD